jgi:Ni/Co efflux regulator RcnB
MKMRKLILSLAALASLALVLPYAAPAKADSMMKKDMMMHHHHHHHHHKMMMMKKTDH